MRAQFIYEKFTQESDPVHDLHIGPYELIKKWLEKYGIQKYTINDDMTIDVHNSVHIIEHDFDKFPEYIQFNKIGGVFALYYTPLISLRGYPKIISSPGDWCSCQHTDIAIIDYNPVYVHHFFCNYCENLPKNEVLKFVRRMKKKDMYIYSDFGEYYKGKKRQTL